MQHPWKLPVKGETGAPSELRPSSKWSSQHLILWGSRVCKILQVLSHVFHREKTSNKTGRTVVSWEIIELAGDRLPNTHETNTPILNNPTVVLGSSTAIFSSKSHPRRRCVQPPRSVGWPSSPTWCPSTRAFPHRTSLGAEVVGIGGFSFGLEEKPLPTEVNEGIW